MPQLETAREELMCFSYKLLFVFITTIDVISKTPPQFRNQAVIYLHDIIGDDLCHSATAGFPPLIRVSLVVIATIHQQPHRQDSCSL